MPRQRAQVLPWQSLAGEASWKNQAKQLCLRGEAAVATGQVHSHSGKFNAHFLQVKGYLFSVWILSRFRLSLVRTKPDQLLLCLTRDIPKLLFIAAVLQRSIPVGSARTSRFVPMEKQEPLPSCEEGLLLLENIISSWKMTPKAHIHLWLPIRVGEEFFCQHVSHFWARSPVPQPEPSV